MRKVMSSGSGKGGKRAIKETHQSPRKRNKMKECFFKGVDTSTKEEFQKCGYRLKGEHPQVTLVSVIICRFDPTPRRQKLAGALQLEPAFLFTTDCISSPSSTPRFNEYRRYPIFGKARGLRPKLHRGQLITLVVAEDTSLPSKSFTSHGNLHGSTHAS